MLVIKEIALPSIMVKNNIKKSLTEPGYHTWVQIGHANDIHPPLDNVINLVGATRNARNLFRLAYSSDFWFVWITFLHHIYGALGKTCVTLVEVLKVLVYSIPYVSFLFSSGRVELLLDKWLLEMSFKRLSECC
jgi:hypothetical protein